MFILPAKFEFNWRFRVGQEQKKIFKKWARNNLNKISLQKRRKKYSTLFIHVIWQTFVIQTFLFIWSQKQTKKSLKLHDVTISSSVQNLGINQGPLCNVKCHSTYSLSQ